MNDDDILPSMESEDEPNEDGDQFDAGDLPAVRKRRKKVDLDYRESVLWWRAAFQTERGRKELWGLLQVCDTFETKFACGPNGFPDERATWHGVGRRSVGEWLFRRWLVECREGCIKMLDEHDPTYRKFGELGL